MAEAVTFTLPFELCRNELHIFTEPISRPSAQGQNSKTAHPKTLCHGEFAKRLGYNVGWRDPRIFGNGTGMIGIMQGRLLAPQEGHAASFPRQRWGEEFTIAAGVPFDYIEWIYDLFGKDVNPLVAPGGLERLRALMDSTGVAIRSVCVNYFMDKLPVCCTDEERNERLRELALILRNGRAIGVERVVLPFLDASAIRNYADFNAVVRLLADALPLAEERGIELHLESSLSASEFNRLLGLLPHPILKVTYDSGNSASLGFVPAEEFAAYGKRIGSVHIKDRMLHGVTVPLGTGSTDFQAVFAELKRVNYGGDFTFEVARGTTGDEFAMAKKNLSFLRDHWRD